MRSTLGYEHIDFRQRDILRLHEMMMSFAGYEYGGQYKTDDNVILKSMRTENRRVRFRPTPKKRNAESNGSSWSLPIWMPEAMQISISFF